MLDQLTPARSPEPGGSEPIFDLREILSFVWRHWKFAAGITAVVLAIGFTVLMRQTPLYTATAQVLLERQREKAPGVEAILAEADPDMAMVEGEMAILRSSVFLRRVVEREHLADLPAAAPHPQPETGIFARIRALPPDASPPQDEPP